MAGAQHGKICGTATVDDTMTTLEEFLDMLFPSLDGEFIDVRLISSVRREQSFNESVAEVIGVVKQIPKEGLLANDFLEDALSQGVWVARKPLLEQAKEAGISRNVLDETFQTLQKVGKLERDDRNNSSQLSIVPDPETEE